MIDNQESASTDTPIFPSINGDGGTDGVDMNYVDNNAQLMFIHGQALLKH